MTTQFQPGIPGKIILKTPAGNKIEFDYNEKEGVFIGGVDYAGQYAIIRHFHLVNHPTELTGEFDIKLSVNLGQTADDAYQEYAAGFSLIDICTFIDIDNIYFAIDLLSNRGPHSRYYWPKRYFEQLNINMQKYQFA